MGVSKGDANCMSEYKLPFRMTDRIERSVSHEVAVPVSAISNMLIIGGNLVIEISRSPKLEIDL